MKEASSLSSYLGLTQEDLGLILNLSRRHISNYESGSRSIPTASLELLSAIVSYVHTPEATLNSPALAKQKELKLKALNDMLEDNDFQQDGLQRKLTRAEAKCESKLKALLTVEFMAQREESQDKTNQAVLRSINSKTEKSLKVNGWIYIFSTQLKLHWLQQQKAQLQAEILTLKRNLKK
ncbi:helix-turn-helix transcriptional regulator [Flavobacterium phycosphaerae]|uniref:helix-turn-helix transcriptional regulator n=1 Tax=Flavobacterium phycosphaerae TaxID=2697515 RepID=UPI00138ABEFA|nr:helix-turn-helix transcriptional regulator [Flavobacterium phycosphaerae]